MVPHIADRHFFTYEVRRLGCGIERSKRRWPEKVARAVTLVEGNAAMMKTALRARNIMFRENGPQRAVQEMEAYLPDLAPVEELI